MAERSEEPNRAEVKNFMTDRRAERSLERKEGRKEGEDRDEIARLELLRFELYNLGIQEPWRSIIIIDKCMRNGSLCNSDQHGTDIVSM